MTEKSKTILNYCVLILLAAAIIAFGRHINSKKVSPPKEDYAKKLAELRADLTKSNTSGRTQQGNTKRTSTRRTTKAGST
jgi:hypothetical protein